MPCPILVDLDLVQPLKLMAIRSLLLVGIVKKGSLDSNLSAGKKLKADRLLLLPCSALREEKVNAVAQLAPYQSILHKNSSFVWKAEGIYLLRQLLCLSNQRRSG